MAEKTQQAANAKKDAKKKKTKKNVPVGKCYVQSGFGNTIVTFTDLNGNVICWSTAGALGFKGSRKGTPFAAQVASEDASRKAVESGLKAVDVLVDGPGSGREPAVRAIAAAGIRITTIKDVTPVPHNGCRPPKRRRV